MQKTALPGVLQIIRLNRKSDILFVFLFTQESKKKNARLKKKLNGS